jgi:four helix bundle protein
LLLKKFPAEKKFALTQQIRRAALSLHLNLSKGFSRKYVSERKRFFEISRGSIIEIDTTFDVHPICYIAPKRNCKIPDSRLTIPDLPSLSSPA